MGEQSCPDLCLCIEAHCCNCLAVSASRIYVMDKYSLSSDPCDYRMIRINNCIQFVAIICDIVGIFFAPIRHAAHLVHHLADLIYHLTSGCMSAQVKKMAPPNGIINEVTFVVPCCK